MQRSEVSTYAEACEWLAESRTVDVNGVATPMKELPVWMLALERCKQTTRGWDSEPYHPDDLVREVECLLPLCVTAIYLEMDMGWLDPLSAPTV